MNKLLVSAIALINDKNEVLLSKRPEGKDLAGLWEFPGGKCEENESLEQCLVREIKEELGITISEESLEPASFSTVTHNGRYIIIALFLCRKWDGEERGMENQEIKWYKPQEITKLKIPKADIPLIKYISSMIL